MGEGSSRDGTWTIGRMLDWMVGYLRRHDDPNPMVSSRWLISDAVNLSQMGLYTHFDQPLNAEELDVIRKNVRRRSEGEPLQYITGKAAFRFIEVEVSPGALIPRPETEVLVSEALSRLPRDAHASETNHGERDILVCDLCTGSGCIAASLAFENKRIKVIATDISEDCVTLASKNVSSLGLSERVDVIRCDLWEGISQEYFGAFDAIISNPPYIPSEQVSTLPKEVGRHEPLLALDGGEDGLDVFRRIAKWSIDALRPNGFLACELHEKTLDAARDIAIDEGFPNVSIVKDLNGLPRVLMAEKGCCDEF